MAEVIRLRLRRTLIVALAAGVVGIALLALAAWLDLRRALLAYLFAYTTVASIAAGGLILYLTFHAANARWPASIRRVHESLILGFPALVVLFVPIALGLRWIYPWADTRELPAPELALIEAKSAWLNPTAFIVRGAVYLLVFLVAAEVMRRWSRRRDPSGPGADVTPDVRIDAATAEHLLARDRRFASVALPLVGLAITGVAFDWLMSLQPTWFSSIFGIYVFAGGFVAALAVLTVLAWRAVATRTAAGAIGPNHFHALGRLLLAFTVFWAYAAYFQGFLIQIADRPIEVTFYLRRLSGGWYSVLVAMLVLRFAVPFALLLPRRPKLRPRYLAVVAGIIVAGHLLDLYWLVVPAHETVLAPSWIDLAALAAIAGLTTACCAWRQRGVPGVAAGDPHLRAAHDYASPT